MRVQWDRAIAGGHRLRGPSALPGRRVLRDRQQALRGAPAGGASCTEDAACKTGNTFREKYSATSTAALDEPCLAKADCAAPNTCLPSGSGSARTCQPRLEPGSTCQADDDCHGLCDRPDGGATGKCVAYCTGATR
ncbi:MAG: hypothetical protein U0235_25095 [Polyangiaceae bacterium]